LFFIKKYPQKPYFKKVKLVFIDIFKNNLFTEAVLHQKEIDKTTN